MTLENASRPVPLAAEAEPQMLTRRALVPLAGALLGGAVRGGQERDAGS